MIPDIIRRLHNPGPIDLYCTNRECEVFRDGGIVTRRLSEVIRNVYWCDVCGWQLSENRSWMALIEEYMWSNFCIQWFIVGWAGILGKE